MSPNSSLLITSIGRFYCYLPNNPSSGYYRNLCWAWFCTNNVDIKIIYRSILLLLSKAHSKELNSLQWNRFANRLSVTEFTNKLQGAGAADLPEIVNCFSDVRDLCLRRLITWLPRRANCTPAFVDQLMAVDIWDFFKEWKEVSKKFTYLEMIGQQAFTAIMN